VPHIASEEIAFALSLFVGSAEGRLTPTHSRHLPSESRCSLCSEQTRSWTDAHSRSPALLAALSAVWDFYGDDPRKADICARIAAFYAVVSKSEGAIISEWVTVSPDNPDESLLDPAIIQAIATTPLNRQTPYTDASFLASVRDCSSPE